MAKFNRKKLIEEGTTPVEPLVEIDKSSAEVPPSIRARTDQTLYHPTDGIDSPEKKEGVDGETVTEFTHPNYFPAVIELPKEEGKPKQREDLGPGVDAPKNDAATYLEETEPEAELESEGEIHVASRDGQITLIGDGKVKGCLTAEAFGQLLFRDQQEQKTSGRSIPIVRKTRPAEPLPFEVPKSPMISIRNGGFVLTGKDGRHIPLSKRELDRLLELYGLDPQTMKPAHIEYPHPIPEIPRRKLRGSPLVIWATVLVASIVGVVLGGIAQPQKEITTEKPAPEEIAVPSPQPLRILPEAPTVEVGERKFTDDETIIYNLLTTLDVLGISTPQSPKKDVKKGETPGSLEVSFEHPGAALGRYILCNIGVGRSEYTFRYTITIAKETFWHLRDARNDADRLDLLRKTGEHIRKMELAGFDVEFILGKILEELKKSGYNFNMKPTKARKAAVNVKRADLDRQAREAEKQRKEERRAVGPPGRPKPNLKQLQRDCEAGRRESCRRILQMNR